MEKKLITHITSDEKYYYLTREVVIFSFPLFDIPRTRIGRELLYKDECLDKVKEFERQAHERFTYVSTKKETIVNQ
ncbi:hypothetical protein [Flavobacterium cerinum]|uniref:Uncharacterized protein n=1 Tax=Flavobacterium cerinum TaxID=2502784 RepID=A0ABY5IRT2_9FLAO|nr:hypothetical protein [Flavobacterium cerinum]UUC45571.1 hypothetical protein NOX80_18365 [Flavobacterium cerinum]